MWKFHIYELAEVGVHYIAEGYLDDFESAKKIVDEFDFGDVLNVEENEFYYMREFGKIILKLDLMD